MTFLWTIILIYYYNTTVNICGLWQSCCHRHQYYNDIINIYDQKGYTIIVYANRNSFKMSTRLGLALQNRCETNYYYNLQNKLATDARRPCLIETEFSRKSPPVGHNRINYNIYLAKVHLWKRFKIIILSITVYTKTTNKQRPKHFI